MLFSPAGTDDSDDLFAMIILPINVYDQQHGSHIRAEANFTERVPALLSRPAIDSIGPDEAVFVLEDERGHFERDSIVNLLVATVFRFGPFVSHRVYTQCIASSAPTNRRASRRFYPAAA
jgi:hypothetical protein